MAAKPTPTPTTPTETGSAERSRTTVCGTTSSTATAPEGNLTYRESYVTYHDETLDRSNDGTSCATTGLTQYTNTSRSLISLRPRISVGLPRKTAGFSCFAESKSPALLRETRC